MQEIEPGREEGDRGQASAPWGHQPRGERPIGGASCGRLVRAPAFCLGGEAPFGGDVSSRARQGRCFWLSAQKSAATVLGELQSPVPGRPGSALWHSRRSDGVSAGLSSGEGESSVLSWLLLLSAGSSGRSCWSVRLRAFPTRWVRAALVLGFCARLSFGGFLYRFAAGAAPRGRKPELPPASGTCAGPGARSPPPACRGAPRCVKPAWK